MEWQEALYTGLFEIIVVVLTTGHPVLRMQPHMISFYGGYVKDQVYVPSLPGTEGTNQNRH